MITLGAPGYVILEFPLYQAISALLYRIFYPDVITARLFAILCGLLSIVFVYRLTRKYLDEQSALFASFFYAFMPLNIFFQRIPMPESLTILLSLVMLDFMIEGINSNKNIFLVCGVIAGSLGLLIKSPFVAPLYLPMAYAVYKQEKNVRALLNIRLLVSFFIPFLLLVLWQKHANSVNEAYFSLPGYPFRELYSSVMVKLHPLNKWYFGTIQQRLDFKNYLTIMGRIYKGMLSFTGVFALALGLFAVVQKKVASFYFIWLAAVLLSFMVIFNLNVVHDYYQLPLAPILAIVCGAGTVYFIDLFRKKVVTIAVIAIMIIPFIYLNCSNVKGFFREENDYVEAGRFIDSHIEKNAMIATALSIDPDTAIWYPTVMYYADRHGFNMTHKSLTEDMIEYLNDRRVKYLAVVDYDGMDKSVNKVLCSYKVINENDRVTIYDITERSVCRNESLLPFRVSPSGIEFNFENGIKGWRALGKTQLMPDNGKHFNGKASMKIAGTGQANLYSFARSAQFSISPGKGYRFTGFMLIDSISDNTSFFKCELYQDGKWIKNIDSNEYDIASKGQWKKLKAEFTAMEGKNVSVSFTVEKRPMEKDVQAVLYVDDIKLEMIK